MPQAQVKTSGPPLLNSVIRAAERLDVSTATIYRLASEGQLRVVKLGGKSMVSETDLQRFAGNLPAADIACCVTGLTAAEVRAQRQKTGGEVLAHP